MSQMQKSTPAAAVTPAAASRVDAAAIQDWLVVKVAGLIGISARSLDIKSSFRDWGLDSIALVGLTGELEEWLGLELSPVLLYERPTIEKLASHLAGMIAARQSA